MSRSDVELGVDALEHIRVLRAHLGRGGLEDLVVADAVSLRLASAIECVAAGRGNLRERIFGSAWNAAWSTRNRIAHGYAPIDLDIIRATIARDRPQVEEALRASLATD